MSNISEKEVIEMEMTPPTPLYYNEQIVVIVMRQLHRDYSDTLTKFSYITGAQDFLRFSLSPDYSTYQRELATIERIAPAISQRLGNSFQMVDLGPGDGQKAMRLINQFVGRTFDYLALDMSQSLLKAAETSQWDIPNRREYHLCDFSNRRELIRELSEYSDRDRLFLLLGNTLTNEVNMEHFLRNFRETINQTNAGGNYLLLGVELLTQDINQIVREYRSEENYILTFRPLEMLGINRQSGAVDISFHEELRRIEEQFIFTRPATIDVNLHRLDFAESDRILLSVTYKPTLNDMEEIIRNAGWGVESVEFERNQMLVLLSSRSDKFAQNRIFYIEEP